MVQYIFYVDKIRDEQQRDAVAACARLVFDPVQVHGSLLTSSVTVTLDQPLQNEEAFVLFQEQMRSAGYEVTLPPNFVELTDDPMAVVEAFDVIERKKKKRRVSVGAFVGTVCAVLVVAVLATYTLTARLFDQRMAEFKEILWEHLEETIQDTQQQLPTYTTSFPELEILQYIFEMYSIEELDQQELLTVILKAYADGSGDRYAVYYTPEELQALDADNQGEMEGIGVSVVDDVVEIDGMPYDVLRVVSVFRESPALEAGLQAGDCIYAVVNEDAEVFLVSELGYDVALANVRGVAGTQAQFSVIRFSDKGAYEIIPFTIERAHVKTQSVDGHVYELDKTIGVVKISQFDLTTPTQFHATMDELIAQGCEKFIFDVRYNPGGEVKSVEAVLSTLLEEGDLMISRVYKDGSRRDDFVQEIYNTLPGYETCDVTPEDIGKYRGYEYVVLTNQYTASAGELFAANLRDHQVATLVGSTTYGKGCLQNLLDLTYFGLEGALKLTTAWYLPPSGENYHDVGIAPDVEVEMDWSLIEKYNSIYLIPDAEDNQLSAAVELLSQIK